jgi:hypothetical protein
MTKRRKPVKRTTDASGAKRPTAREVDFVRLIAGYLHFPLPRGLERDLSYVRIFLDTFAYSRTGAVTKDDVRRRCALARVLAYEERPIEDYVEKLGVTRAQAELLQTFGRRAIPRHWMRTDEDEAASRKAEPVEEMPPEPDVDAMLDMLPESPETGGTKRTKSALAA